MVRSKYFPNRLSAAVVLVAVTAALAALAAASNQSASASTSTVVLRGSGTARGGFSQTRHRDTGASQRIISDDMLAIQGRFSFTFEVDEKGAVTGTGTGEYVSATSTITGTRAGVAFSCSPAVAGSPFTVSLAGKMEGTVITLNARLPDAQETSASTACGALGTISEAKTKLLAGSLGTTLGKNGFVFKPGKPTQTLTKDENKTGGQYTTWAIRHEWTIDLQPPACPASHDKKAVKAYDAAQKKLAVTERNAALAFSVYETLSAMERRNLEVLENAVEVVKKGGARGVKPFWMLPAVSGKWIRSAALPKIDSYNRSRVAARNAWKAADASLARSAAEVVAARPLRIACERDARTIGRAADKRAEMIAQTRKLIARWNASKRLSLTPSKAPLLSESAELAAVVRGLPTVPLSSTVPVSAARLQETLARLNRVLALHREAMRLQDRAATLLVGIGKQARSARSR